MDSFLSWIGGKKLLRKTIIENFPDTKQFNRYVEVFGGAGWVLFAKERHATNEVYNDINSNLTNLFKCVKYHAEELQKELNFTINSRDLFNEYISQINSKGLTDIQRAARYFYIIKLSYGSKSRYYGAVKRDIEKMKSYLQDIQERLRNVVIENKSFDDMIEKYDSKETLFYFDPPYFNAEKCYVSEFIQDHHELLSQLLKNIEGKFILSYNDDEYIRNLYKDFNIIETERNNNLTSKYAQNGRYKELLIRNY
ncbi:D12 class N6 adenine-specific DNA methyltransferase [Peptostreptococcaceae bacterium AS15]|nr:D12 class N6 adenine-specific DNA methyltransferase [Peptostreptococcaceae bacterium AS15]